VAAPFQLTTSYENEGLTDEPANVEQRHLVHHHVPLRNLAPFLSRQFAKHIPRVRPQLPRQALRRRNSLLFFFSFEIAVIKISIVYG
jgi:hypothetical protein